MPVMTIQPVTGMLFSDINQVDIPIQQMIMSILDIKVVIIQVIIQPVIQVLIPTLVIGQVITWHEVSIIPLSVSNQVMALDIQLHRVIEIQP